MLRKKECKGQTCYHHDGDCEKCTLINKPPRGSEQYTEFFKRGPHQNASIWASNFTHRPDFINAYTRLDKLKEESARKQILGILDSLNIAIDALNDEETYQEVSVLIAQAALKLREMNEKEKGNEG